MKIHKSISHYTAKEQNKLHCIKKKIVTYAKPLIIFCYGSKVIQSIERNCFSSQKRIEDWHFSCDLLIIVADSTRIGTETLAEIERLTKPHGQVKATVCRLDDLLRELIADNFFYRWVRRSAIILHEKDNTLQHLLLSIPQTADLKKRANEFFAADLDVAKYVSEKILSVNDDIPSKNIQTVTKPVTEDKQTQFFTNHLPIMTYQLQDSYPRLLTPDELANPHSLSFSFYTSYDLAQVKKIIADWMEGVYKPINRSKESPANLLYFYDLLIRLIEAAWLIHYI